MRAGVPHRLRLINITPSAVGLNFFLFDRIEQITWKPLAKDGWTLPPGQTAVRPARQLVSVGETYDFEIQPTRGQLLWLDVPPQYRGVDGTSADYGSIDTDFGSAKAGAAARPRIWPLCEYVRNGSWLRDNALTGCEVALDRSGSVDLA